MRTRTIENVEARIAVLVFLMMIFIAIAFFAGVYVGKKFFEPIEPPIGARRVGYKVIDADHIVNGNGDTVRYNWQPLKRR